MTVLTVENILLASEKAMLYSIVAWAFLMVLCILASIISHRVKINRKLFAVSTVSLFVVMILARIATIIFAGSFFVYIFTFLYSFL